jgi:hypothetical protein
MLSRWHAGIFNTLQRQVLASEILFAHEMIGLIPWSPNGTLHHALSG